MQKLNPDYMTNPNQMSAIHERSNESASFMPIRKNLTNSPSKFSQTPSKGPEQKMAGKGNGALKLANFEVFKMQ